MMYVFMSFASVHSGKNIGCCIVEVDDPNDANDKCMELGLTPNECNHARGFVIQNPDDEDMELNRFYTSDEMLKRGYEKQKVTINAQGRTMPPN